MTFPPRAGRDFGRATPSLRHAQRAKPRIKRNPAGPPLSLAGICSDNQSQLLAQGPQCSWDDPIHEPEGKLLGQCLDGKLLWHDQNRTRASSLLPGPGGCPARSVCLHRRILQSSAASFRPLVYHPRTARAPSRLIRCPLNRGKVSPQELGSRAVGIKPTVLNTGTTSGHAIAWAPGGGGPSDRIHPPPPTKIVIEVGSSTLI